MSNIPLKRAFALQPLSRDHHHALLLVWKIKTGLSKGIAAERIKNYANWFYLTHLLPHFNLEEKYLFPILGSKNILIEQALAEHQKLSNLFGENTDLEVVLKLIEIELENHIRYEERILFNEIQKVASDEQLQKLQTLFPEEPFADNLTDPFWI